MTVRGLSLALALMAATPVDAAHGRCYSRWFYPWPQRCGVGEIAHSFARPISPIHVNREKAAIELPTEPDIPLPALDRADFTVAEPDDVTRARLQLMGYAYAH